MCPDGWTVLVLLLRLAAAAPSTQEEGDEIKRCLETSRAGGCLEDLASELVENAVVPERLSVFPGLELVRTNSTARGLADLSNRTIDMDILKVAEGLAKGPRSSKKKRRMYMVMIMTALIAAKAAAVATSASILVPMALKGITLLAVKALVIGKIAVVVASAFGFLRLISGSTEHTTEVIYNPKPAHHKRVDHSVQFIPHGYSLLKKDHHAYRPHHHFTSSSGGQHHFGSEPQHYSSGSSSMDDDLEEESQPSPVYRFPPPHSQTVPPTVVVRRPSSTDKRR